MTFNTEILIFNSTEKYRADPSIATKAIKLALEADGSREPGYYGVGIDDPKLGYTFLHWESYEIHKAFASSPVFPSIAAAFQEAYEGKTEVYDVQYSGPTIALEQPITEILVFTLKAPENRDAVVEILSRVSEVLEGMSVFGQTRQDENKYVIIAGWPTIEAHWEAAAKPEFSEEFKKIWSLANREFLGHTSLTRYTL